MDERGVVRHVNDGDTLTLVDGRQSAAGADRRARDPATALRPRSTARPDPARATRHDASRSRGDSDLDDARRARPAAALRPRRCRSSQRQSCRARRRKARRSPYFFRDAARRPRGRAAGCRRGGTSRASRLLGRVPGRGARPGPRLAHRRRLTLARRGGPLNDQLQGCGIRLPLGLAVVTRFWHPVCRHARRGGDGELMLDRGEGSHLWDDRRPPLPRRHRRPLVLRTSATAARRSSRRRPRRCAACTRTRTTATCRAAPRPLWPSGSRRSRRWTTPSSSSPRGGGESIETAVKLVRRFWSLVDQPERTVIVSRERAYHGLAGYGTSIVGTEVVQDRRRAARRATRCVSPGTRRMRSRAGDRRGRAGARGRVLLRADHRRGRRAAAARRVPRRACSASAASATCCSSWTR